MAERKRPTVGELRARIKELEELLDYWDDDMRTQSALEEQVKRERRRRLFAEEQVDVLTQLLKLLQGHAKAAMRAAEDGDMESLRTHDLAVLRELVAWSGGEDDGGGEQDGDSLDARTRRGVASELR